MKASPEKIEQITREVLTQTKYDLGTKPKEVDLIPDWLRDLLDFLSPIVEPFRALLAFSPFLYYCALLALALITCVLLFQMIKSMHRGLTSDAKLHYESGSEAVVSPEDMERIASQHMDHRRWDEALRLWLGAAILRIEPDKRLRRRGLTNRSLLLRHRNSAIGPYLGVLITHFDRCWYGDTPCSQDVAMECRDAYGQISKISANPKPS